MRKLRWWQWGLGGIAVLYVIGSLADLPKTQRQAPPTPIASPEVRELRKDGFFAIIVDRRQDPQSLPTLARELCGAREFCIVSGWADRDRAARGYPYTEREAASIAFSYLVNRSTGAEQILWDCRVWPSVEKASCSSS